MKIITVNVPESDVEAMANLVGDEGLYPSRSELIRVAVREYLIKQLKIARKVSQTAEKTTAQKIITEKVGSTEYIKIPIGPTENLANNPQYKTYKIITKE